MQETISQVKKAECFYDGYTGDLLLNATQELIDLAEKNKTLTKGTMLDAYRDKIESHPFPFLSDAEYKDVYDKLDSLMGNFCGERAKANGWEKDPEFVILSYIVHRLWCD